MTLSVILSAGLWGIEAYPVHVEVDCSNGFPGWSTVGLAESSVRESKDRVLSALHNCGYFPPPQKTTLNFAPADIKKQGTAFDLPVALGLLASSELLPNPPISKSLFIGELSLNGTIRPVRGVLSIALLARKLNLNSVVVPLANLAEAPHFEDLPIYGAPDLPSVVEFIRGASTLPKAGEYKIPIQPVCATHPDFKEIKGQAFAKRALEVAAAGFHHALLVGPPGTGKSMLADRLPSILPPLNNEESLTTTQIYSLLGLLNPGESLIRQRPFRSPHHTISYAGLIGGGKYPRPGEISLSHNGVLFLDEFTEFKRHVLDSLRQPLETHLVTISRAMHSLTFPARFLLIAAMNPCPCGFLGHPQKTCRCSPLMVQKYQAKVSGPLLDRIDLQIEVQAATFEELNVQRESESSAQILGRVLKSRELQAQRLESKHILYNSQMGPQEIEKYCRLDKQSSDLLEKAIQKWGLSARAYHRLLKVARTIADLAGDQKIAKPHLLEALSYRYGHSKN